MPHRWRSLRLSSAPFLYYKEPGGKIKTFSITSPGDSLLFSRLYCRKEPEAHLLMSLGSFRMLCNGIVRRGYTVTS